MRGHTPGPWITRISPFSHWEIFGGPGKLAIVSNPNDPASPPNSWQECEANARLIAAAPTGLSAGIALLEVAEAAIRMGDWNVDGRCDPDSAISLMKKFIAAATGDNS